MHRFRIRGVLWVSVGLGVAGLTTGSISGAEPSGRVAAVEGEESSRPLVGVSYSAGWWKPLPNKRNYSPEIGDWRSRFPERVPLLGQYNDQPTMDKEIIAAAEHGVDFFLILWYYNGPSESQEREKNARFLNEGVKTFVRSPEAHRMKFVIEYCNHAPYRVKTDEDWTHCVRAWVEAPPVPPGTSSARPTRCRAASPGSITTCSMTRSTRAKTSPWWMIRLPPNLGKNRLAFASQGP